MQLSERVRRFREAGHTKRHHTKPIIGEQKVSEHSWHVATLILLLNPEPSPALVRAALWHDAAERWTGDVPAPAKWSSSSLDVGMNAAQAYVEKQVLEMDTSGLAEIEERWLRACDILECWLFAHDQKQLGNRNVSHMAVACERWLRDNSDRVPPAVLSVLANYNPVYGPDHF